MSDQQTGFDIPVVRPAIEKRRRGRGGTAGMALGVTILVTTVSIMAYPHIPRWYAGSADVVMRASTVEGGTNWEQSIQAQIDDNAIQTKMDLLQSEPLQEAVIKDHGLVADPEFNPRLRPSLIRAYITDNPRFEAWFPDRPSDESEVLASLKKHLRVTRENKSYLLRVGYTSENAQKAADLTNALVQSFLAQQSDQKKQDHDSILQALRDHVVRLEQRYHTDEENMHKFEESSGLLHVGDKASWQEQLRTLSGQIAEAHRRTSDTSARAALLADLRGSALSNTSEALSSPTLQHLRERYVELTSGTGTGTLPTGLTPALGDKLRQMIDAEAGRLVQAARSESVVALQNELALHQEAAKLDSHLMAWGENERRRDDLRRGVQTDLDELNAAHQRYSQEAVRGDTLLSDIDSVSMSRVPQRAAFPNLIIYAAGTVALLIFLNGLLFLPKLRKTIYGV
jgi:succinoglycan biosynthesis transport protein ExoP